MEDLGNLLVRPSFRDQLKQARTPDGRYRRVE